MKIKLLFVIFFIAFNSKASNFYWVGGTGNWNDFATHWATTSGGSTFHLSPPSLTDDVIFDINSFSSNLDEVLISSNVFSKTMTFNNSFFATIASSSIFSTWAISGDINIYTPFNFSYSGTLLINGNCNLRSAFTTFNCALKISVPGMTVNLMDSLKNENKIIFESGTFNSMNNTIHVSEIETSNSQTIAVNMGTSVIYISGDAMCMGLLATFDFSSSTIFIGSSLFRTDSSIGKLIPISSFREIYYLTIDTLIAENIYNFFIDRCTVKYLKYKNDSAVLGNLQLKNETEIDFIDASEDSSNMLHIVFGLSARRVGKTITAQNTQINGVSSPATIFFDIDTLKCKKNLQIFNFSPLQFETKLRAKYIEVSGNGMYGFMNCNFLQLYPNTTHTFENKFKIIIDSISAVGLPGQEIVFQSDSSGIQDTISMMKDFCGDYLRLQDMKIIGFGDYFAGANSISVSNNSGWTFSSCVIGLEEIVENKNQFLYPIPARDKVNFNEPVDAIKIFDLTGNLVYSTHVNQISSLELASFKGNFFTVELTNINGVSRRKLIVN